jgi:RND family efflux transporter MFP subunit
VTILDISSVKVKVSIPEAEISGITASTPTTINVEAAQKQVSGGRIEKGIQADALTHTYDVRINVQNGDRKLLPGMVASVSLTPGPSLGGEGSDYLVPVTAVQKAADGSLFVWTVAADSTVHRSKVSIGVTSGNHVAITDGLDMGQCVVTEGYQKLSEGTRVVY